MIYEYMEWISGQQSRIFHTSDGGQSWQSSVIAARHMGAAPVFVDAQHGWALATDNFPGFDPSSTFVGQQIALFRTVDGGQTWERILSGDAHGSGDAFGTAPLIRDAIMRFTSTTTGWIAGYTYLHNVTTPWLYVTHDAGKTWQQVSIALPAGSVLTQTPIFFTGQNGLLPVSTSGPAPQYASGTKLYVTHDGGKTWIGTASLPFDITGGNFLDFNHGWAATNNTDDKAFYTTDDGWYHWQKERLNATFKRVYGFNFVSPLVGWALGTDAMAFLPEPGGGLRTGDVITLLRTIDGGQTWREMAHSTV